mgnify:CR=1 FL=1
MTNPNTPEGTPQALIVRDFELAPIEEVLDEAQLLALLSEHIAYLIDHRLEFLLSLMYRLDIDERKVNRALSPGHAEPAQLALARLVLERQQQRILTKQQYRQAPIDDAEWE